MSIKIWIDGEPPTITQKNTIRFNRRTGHVFHDKKFLDCRDAIREELLKTAPETPLDGLLKLTLKLYWTPPKSKKKAVWRNTKPDCDNSLAVVADQLEKTGYVVNDSRFVIEHVEKHYSDNPHTEIIIEEL